MQEITQTTYTFPYTARLKAYLGTVCALMSMTLLEGGVLTFVLILFIHNDWLKVLPVILIGAFLLYILFGVLLAPLYTQHRLTATALELRYGFALRVVIPRAAIASARPVAERLNMLQPLKAQYDARVRRITAAFSEQGQILLTLNMPLILRVGRAAVPVATILINADDRDTLLTMLFLPSPTRTQSIAPSPVWTQFIAPTLRPTTNDSNEIVIRAEQLIRRFGSFTAVERLNLSIHRGEIYGFLGANGAGKTTTIKMLVGLLKPDAGHAWIAGYDVWSDDIAAKRSLGYVADRAIVYERLTGREFLCFMAQMRGLPQAASEERISRLLDLLELTDEADRLCGAYSFGMKRKLSLAAALLPQPQVCILDEPLSGLDPRSARRVKDLLIALSADGTTILLSTHDLATAASICHRVGILHHGTLLAEGSVADLERITTTPDLESAFLNITNTMDIAILSSDTQEALA